MNPCVITGERDYGHIQCVGFQFGKGDAQTRYALSFAANDTPEEIAEALHALAGQMGVRNPVAVETAGVRKIAVLRANHEEGDA